MLHGPSGRWIIPRSFTLLTTEMPAISAIQFTQDQARTVTGVSVETVRHWRKTIPYLAAKTGKAARFTFADLVGLAVTNTLVSSLGVQIAALSSGVDALFRLLATIAPSSLDSAIVLITATGTSLYEPGADGVDQLPSTPALMVPLTPLVANIQRYMLPVGRISPQVPLPFPPEAVRSRA